MLLSHLNESIYCQYFIKVYQGKPRHYEKFLLTEAASFYVFSRPSIVRIMWNDVISTRLFLCSTWANISPITKFLYSCNLLMNPLCTFKFVTLQNMFFTTFYTNLHKFHLVSLNSLNGKWPLVIFLVLIFVLFHSVVSLQLKDFCLCIFILVYLF